MEKILRRAAAAAATLALAFSVTVSTELPAEAAGGCRITFGTYSNLSKGSKGSKARAAECLLRRAGYPATVNGSFSSHDAAKLKKFQGSARLAKSGKVTRQTWAALIAHGAKPSLRSGAEGAEVRRLQAALRATGYKLSITGSYGTATVKAVKAVQVLRGWKVTGQAGVGTWTALQTGKAIKPKVTKKKSSTKSSTKGKKALAFAKRQLGDRYRYGGTGPNAWDCSGLTRGAWKAAGVKIPRTSGAQYRVGKKVKKSDLRAGDLVFFYSGISHVALYAGGGKVIHASQPGKPVAYIKMKYMPYKGARRPA